MYNLGSAAKFHEGSSAIFSDVIWWNDIFSVIKSPRNVAENIPKFLVTAVPADDQAPVGSRPSEGTMMTKYGSRLCTEGYLKFWLIFLPSTIAAGTPFILTWFNFNPSMDT